MSLTIYVRRVRAAGTFLSRIVLLAGIAKPQKLLNDDQRIQSSGKCSAEVAWLIMNVKCYF